MSDLFLVKIDILLIFNFLNSVLLFKIKTISDPLKINFIFFSFLRLICLKKLSSTIESYPENEALGKVFFILKKKSLEKEFLVSSVKGYPLKANPNKPIFISLFFFINFKKSFKK
jgi:hypothetical protein